MRWNGILTLTFAAALFAPDSAPAASFGQVVAIGGAASDIALDESRGLLYIANFGAATVEKMSLSDYSIQSSFNVAPQPGALAISQDSQYLLVAHYANGATSPQGSNLITLIHLSDGSRLTFTTGDPPLGVAFFCTSASCTVAAGVDRYHHQRDAVRSGFRTNHGSKRLRQPRQCPACVARHPT